MPRLDSSSSGGSKVISLPFKAIGLVALIACGIGYIVYQYEQLHPEPRKPAAAKMNSEQTKQQMFQKLALTDEQKSKLAQLQGQTTDPQRLRRDAIKVLTDEQKARLKNLRGENDALRAAERERRQARMNKFYPGTQRQVAESKNKELQAQVQARRAAANAPGPSAAPKP
ncbi:MAG: hypothetical protein ACR2IE_17435 [Candidatus Sumerlaeaceae bacterium]